MLELPEVSNVEYDARRREIDLTWLRDTLLEEEFLVQDYWSTIEGITSLYFSADSKRWLTLVARRMCPLGNLTDMTYPRALVVDCAMKGIGLNVGEKIVFEWKNLY